MVNPFKVALADNRLSDRGVAAIVDGLRGCGQLDELDLSKNVVAGRATAAFVRAIAEPAVRATLRTLSLEKCHLSGRAMASLAEAFMAGDEPAALHKLNLARNAVDADCAVQGRKRVIQRRFNVSVPRARVSEKAPTLRKRPER